MQKAKISCAESAGSSEVKTSIGKECGQCGWSTRSEGKIVGQSTVQKEEVSSLEIRRNTESVRRLGYLTMMWAKRPHEVRSWCLAAVMLMVSDLFMQRLMLDGRQ